MCYSKEEELFEKLNQILWVTQKEEEVLLDKN